MKSHNDTGVSRAEALIAAGKHVLCGKPLAGSMDDAKAMVAMEKDADAVSAIGYTFRRSPAIGATSATSVVTVVGAYPKSPGFGAGNAEMSVYQCRAFVDQVTIAPNPLPANASFADPLHDGDHPSRCPVLAVRRPARCLTTLISNGRPHNPWLSNSALTPPACTIAPWKTHSRCSSPTA